MSAKAIYEATLKDLLNRFLCSGAVVKSQFAVIDENSDWQKVVDQNPWLLREVNTFYYFFVTRVCNKIILCSFYNKLKVRCLIKYSSDYFSMIV